MPPKMKTCSKCGEMKPQSAFAKNRCRRDGLDSYCKICNAARKKARDAQLVKDGMCRTGCGSPATEGRGGYCNPCADAINASNKARKAEHRAAAICVDCGAPAAEGRGGLCDPCADANNERNKARKAKHRAEGNCIQCGAPATEGRGGYCDPCADANNESTKAYYAERPHAARANNANRNARLAGVYGTLTELDVARVWTGRCAYPGCTKTEESGVRFSLDHIVPLSLGGPNIVSNICCMCLKHNRDAKKNKLVPALVIQAGLADPHFGKWIDANFDIIVPDDAIIDPKLLEAA